jgi:predicted transcriptional regulator
MTAFTLGEAAAIALGQGRPVAAQRRGAPRRAGVPVRGGSLEAGSFEERFFTPPAPGETDRLLRLARAALDAGRRLKRAARGGRSLSAAERALCGLTAGAVRVYEELLLLARVCDGRIYPSYDRLARATALGRATVARALPLLEAAGFLVRQRRFRRLEGEGAGPRYAQTSNAYRPTAPARVMGWLPRWLHPAPVPDCEARRGAERNSEQARMLATLSCRALAEVSVGGALGRTLARLGARIDAAERESHNGSESPHQIIDPSSVLTPPSRTAVKAEGQR